MAQAAYGTNVPNGTQAISGADLLAKIHTPNAPGPGPKQRPAPQG